MSDLDLARELMLHFAAETGLTGSAPPRRYLWTDAFATCNFLGLHDASGEQRHLDLALRLVDQVHHVLGRHREDDARRGWLSGLTDEEGERHPTRGGLRIGKPLPERQPHEPFDADLEWERDGQYFHYLTKWMHALRRVATATGEPQFLSWAVELAEAAHAAFTVPGGGTRKRMVWKVSVDLGRPLVPSMGQHDPLDALVTYLELRQDAGGGALSREIADAEATCEGGRWATDDPLGLGGLLTDATRVVGLVSRGAAERRPLARVLVRDALASLRSEDFEAMLSRPPSRRLAFRELGLSIGLHAVERALRLHPGEAGEAHLEALEAWRPLASAIESAWTSPDARRVSTWTDHRDINGVMLATSLAPEGYLGGPREAGAREAP